MARHEPDPQEFQVSMNREETGLGRSQDSSRRVLNTTDSEAVGLWAPSPSGSGTQGETPKMFSGGRAGSDLSSAGRCWKPERSGGGASEGVGAQEMRAPGKCEWGRHQGHGGFHERP